MTILYFTATGNNLYIAKKFNGKLVSIPQAIKEGNYNFKDDKVGIIFPIYGWAVPKYIRDFLKKVNIDSKYIFAIMSYGMLAGGATDHLLTISSENNIVFSYINTIKMVDNYLPGFKMEKELEKEPEKQIETHLNTIVEDIRNSKQWIPKASFINKFMTKRLLKSDNYKTGVGFSDKFSIEDTCTKCGTCVKVCPVDNIQMVDGKPVFSKTCISCLACTQNCPKNAIRLSTEKSQVRFRNKNISLKEIIDSNSRGANL